MKKSLALGLITGILLFGLLMNNNIYQIEAVEQESETEDEIVLEFTYDQVKYSISEEKDIGYVLTVSPLDSEGTNVSSRIELNDYKDKIAKVVIAEGIEAIGERSFMEFTNLKEVTLPNSLHRMSIQSFYKCSSLKYIKIPGKVLSIPTQAFSSCTSLEKVELPEGLLTINDYAFGGCESLKSIKIPDSCKVIGKGAFGSCKMLWDVYIPDTPITINPYAFLNCEKLYDIRITNDDADIKERVFSDCTTIFCSKNSKVYAIYSEQCFTEDDLTGQAGENVTYDYDVDTMTMYFRGSGNMYEDFYRRINTCVEHIVFDNEITGIVSCQFCYSLKSVKLPESISVIPSGCFYCCYNLESVKIPAKVDMIMGTAFEESGIRTIEFEDYDKSVWIGQNAFKKCENLESIRIPKYSEDNGTNILWGCSALKSIYCSVNMDLNRYLLDSLGELSVRPDCIYGYKFSKAEDFAKEYNIPFVSVSWTEEDGKWFWYEEGIKQGTEGRGKEIYDYVTQSWYWLDADNDGAKAVSKDVYMESDAGVWADKEDGTGKWVRYDADGHMIKGWYTDGNGTCYFDATYGTMAKGTVIIDEKEYTFDNVTGILLADGWVEIEGKQYWYENNIRQGYDSQNSEYRGKEIYDPSSDAWYWLDNVQQGAKAASKDVYQESQSDEAGNIGKWVRYDENGHMVKGWNTNDAGTYYFDPVYGTMMKGKVVIEGKEYDFDETTGIMR